MKYTIKKGKHWPQWWWLRWLKLWDWPLFYGDTISYKVRFHKDCEQPYMAQWNKLFGFSIGLNPMKHNARFVFDFFQDDFRSLIQLTYFTHQFYKHDGAETRSHANLRWLTSGSEYILSIKKSKMANGKCRLVFKHYDQVIRVEETEIPYSKWGWKLYPYIGGTQPAKQDCAIELTRIAPKWQYHFKGLWLVIAIVILIITINL